MKKNIFEDVEKNYFEIQPGIYDCKVNLCVNYLQDNSEIIEFYVSYIEDNQEKNISVKYIFSNKSKSKTMTELLEILYPLNPSLGEDSDLIFELYNNKEKLLRYCKQLENKWLKLKVELKPKFDGTVYKSIRLKID